MNEAGKEPRAQLHKLHIPSPLKCEQVYYEPGFLLGFGECNYAFLDG